MSRIALAVAAAVAVASLAGCGSPDPSAGHADQVRRTAAGRSDPTPTMAARSRVVLSAEVAALARRDRPAWTAAWSDAPAARAVAGQLYANLTHLGVPRVTARLRPATVRRTSAGWSALVDVGWRPNGATGSAGAVSTVRCSFAEGSGHARLTGVEAAPGDRAPVWLLPTLIARHRGGDRVVAGNARTASRVLGLLAFARGAVRAVLPSWRGSLTAYAPSTSAQFDALLAADPGDYAGTAAVTTTVDGSLRRGAPTAIVLNPSVLPGLDTLNARILLAHEATHQATGAAAVQMPLWVAEGFADFVALRAVGLPLSEAAGHALAQVRRQGLPAALPSDADFDPGPGAETAYERAWLAADLIAQRYGRSRLVAFYRAVETHPRHLAAAFASVLHTSEAGFTVQWRGFLAAKANARSPGHG